MRQPLKVKIFMDVSASVVEEQVNAWLAKLESATVIKTETVVTTVAKGDGASPFIVVTIWYELPPPEQDRPGFRAS